MKKIIMLMIIPMLLIGCGKKENIDEATKDAINKGDSNNAVALLVEYGIDLESIKPDKTISSVTYEEAGENKKGVIFYLEESNRKDVLSSIVNYFKIISENDKLYEKEIDEDTKKIELEYKYNNKNVEIKIEFEKRACDSDIAKNKCDTYGITFE